MPSVIKWPVVDAVYFRVSTDRQTTENQFADVLAELGRCRCEESVESIRDLLTRLPASRQTLQDSCAVYIEYHTAKKGSTRPVFERLKIDAVKGIFTRLLVWKVSRLGRDMREVISTVYELSDLGITVVPVKSHTGPITSSLGKLLWAIQAWFSEMENEERAENIKAGLKRAKTQGAVFGRPRLVFDRQKVIRMRKEGMSWRQISKTTGLSMGTVRRAAMTIQ